MQERAYPMATDFDGAFQGPPRWSALAITAFVLSFLGFLGFTAVLGIILGIAGIVVTGPAKRRGRGLAIAAIPISLVTGGLGAAAVYGAVTFWRMLEVSQKAASTMSVPADQTDQGASELLALGSKSLQATVSPPQVVDWLQGVRRKHGSFVSLQKELETDLVTAGSGGRPILNLSSKFTNGPALIRITFAADSLLHPKIDDIEVDGVAVRSGTDFGAGP